MNGKVVEMKTYLPSKPGEFTARVLQIHNEYAICRILGDNQRGEIRVVVNNYFRDKVHSGSVVIISTLKEIQGHWHAYLEEVRT